VRRSAGIGQRTDARALRGQSEFALLALAGRHRRPAQGNRERAADCSHGGSSTLGASNRARIARTAVARTRKRRIELAAQHRVALAYHDRDREDRRADD